MLTQSRPPSVYQCSFLAPPPRWGHQSSPPAAGPLRVKLEQHECPWVTRNKLNPLYDTEEEFGTLFAHELRGCLAPHVETGRVSGQRYQEPSGRRQSYCIHITPLDQRLDPLRSGDQTSVARWYEGVGEHLDGKEQREFRRLTLRRQFCDTFRN